MAPTEFDLAAAGTQLQALAWMPETPLQAGIVLVHGQGEHIGRYNHFADFFNERGFGVIGVDHVGHGHSPGKRGHIKSYNDYLDACRAMLLAWKERAPNIPIFLYSQSMGGNIAANFLLREKPAIAGAVLSSSWFQLAFDPPAIKVRLASLMQGIWPSYSEANNLNADQLSRDPVVCEDYRHDPLVHDKITAGAFFSIHEAGLYAMEHAAELTVPTLVMHGTGDEITSCSASETFAASAGPHATFQAWEGAFHELHNETNRGEVMAFAHTWMAGVLAAKG